MSASESRSAVVLGLAEEFLGRYRQGERPSLKEYIDRYPELAAEIKEVFPAMALMENVALADESLAGDATGPTSPSAAATPQQLGDYRILREVGRGGMGIVYEAEQISLGRHVALKVLPRNLFVEAQQRLRFEREAKAAARLHHTNIVPVFGVGEHDGMPYYVMQFIQGLGLDEVCKELRRMQGGSPELPATRRDVSAAEVARSLLTGGFLEAERSRVGASDEPASEPNFKLLTEPPSAGRETFRFSSSSVSLPGSAASQGKIKKATYWQSVAQIGIQVAAALEYAHKQGIQHRDIKPSNLLLDTRGTVWVTDFGLARAENEEHLTRTGDIVGTLRYMPPEAFEGRTDFRSDLYSLGLTLYELLALEPAFAEKERHKLIKRVTTEEPVRLDKLNRAIPRDLETIVHKAIDHDPARRYQTAGELTADLQRFLDDEPIHARRVSSLERSWRWCRHHPGVASLTAMLVLILVGVTVASVVVAEEKDAAARNEKNLREQAEQAQKQAEDNLKEADRQKKRAEANYAQARKAVEESFTKVSESQLLQVPGMQPLRRDLLLSSLTFFQDFLKERRDDPTLRGELAATYLRVGQIHDELEEKDEARKAWGQARQLYDALTKAEPQSVEWQHGLAQASYHLNLLSEAIALWEKLVQPGQPRFQKELADAYNKQAVDYTNVGHPEQALEAHQKALAIREMLVRLNPDGASARHALGQSLNNIGWLLERNGRSADALPLYRRAIVHGEIAWAREPHVILYGKFLARCYRNTAEAERALAHLPEALPAYQRSAEIWRKLARDNPAIPEPHSQLFGAYRDVALCQRDLKQPQQAERTMRLAHEMIEQLPTNGPFELFNLACVRAQCAALLAPEKGKATAEDRAERKREEDLAMEALKKAVAAGYRNTFMFQYSADLNALRGRDDFKALEADLKARRAAGLSARQDAAQEALRLHEKMAQADPQNKRLRADLAASRYAFALTLLDAGKLEEARKHLEQTVALREELVKDEPDNKRYRNDLTDSRFPLGDFSWQAGRLSEAAKLWQRELEKLEQAAHAEKDNPTSAEQLTTMRRKIAHTYAQAGLWTEAAAAYDQLLERYGLLDKDYLCAACVALRAGEDSLYRKSCAALVRRVGETSDIERFCGLAWIHVLSDKVPKAPAQLLAWAQKPDPVGNPWRCHVLGLVHYRAGQFADAISWASKAAAEENYAGHILNYPLLALAHHRQGHAKEARHWLDKAREQWSNQSPMARDITVTTIIPAFQDHWRIEWQDWVIFEILLHQAAEAVTGAPPAEAGYGHAHRGFLYGRLDKRDLAETLWQQAVKLLPDKPSLALVRIRQLIEQKRLAEATDALAKLTQLRSNDAEIWKERGRLYFAVGKRDQAIADFRKSLQIRQMRIPTPRSEADELFNQQFDEDNLRRLTAVVESVPQQVVPRWQRGNWYAERERWKEAAADYKLALENAPPSNDMYPLIAAPVIFAADPEDYRKYRRALLQCFGDIEDPTTAERIGKSCLLLPDSSPEMRQACGLADRAAKLGKEHNYWLYFLFCKALADYRRKDYRAAIEALEGALPRFIFPAPVASQGYFVLAMAHQQQGDTKAAREHLAKATKLLKARIPNPEHSARTVDSRYDHDWLIAWHLYREASVLIDGKKAETKK